MCAAECSSAIDHDRRRLLRIVATGIAVASTANLLPRRLAAAPEADVIRPFKINIPEDQLVDLRRRIAATRWPDQETVTDDSQGERVATIQQLARYWGTDYDWRKCEASLNALPHFMTKIDELDIHFVHVRSVHEQALPLIVTHGWPGSIIEQLKIIGPLANPTAHGAAASDAFHLVIPSIPGYGFSSRPTMTGWGPDGEAKYDHLEKRLAQFPMITVPTITMEGDAKGALHPEPSIYAKKTLADMSTAQSPAALVTTFRKKRRRLLPRRL
jgi:Epoxide hydrolase N terminus